MALESVSYSTYVKRLNKLKMRIQVANLTFLTLEMVLQQPSRTLDTFFLSVYIYSIVPSLVSL